MSSLLLLIPFSFSLISSIFFSISILVSALSMLSSISTVTTKWGLSLTNETKSDLVLRPSPVIKPVGYENTVINFPAKQTYKSPVFEYSRDTKAGQINYFITAQSHLADTILYLYMTNKSYCLYDPYKCRVTSFTVKKDIVSNTFKYSLKFVAPVLNSKFKGKLQNTRIEPTEE